MSRVLGGGTWGDVDTFAIGTLLIGEAFFGEYSFTRLRCAGGTGYLDERVGIPEEFTRIFDGLTTEFTEQGFGAKLLVVQIAFYDYPFHFDRALGCSSAKKVRYHTAVAYSK
ncbi:MAG: hypothetical protein VCD00_01615 [Candidatus Hydrogenedentota bacterium]